jgi:hypothetical protein
VRVLKALTAQKRTTFWKGSHNGVDLNSIRQFVPDQSAHPFAKPD